MDILWQRENWLSAPFLKALSGQQLYEMMVAIREHAHSGVMECATENGGVVMLHFLAGKPQNDRGLVSDMVRKEQVVVAWMPQREARDDLVPGPGSEPTIDQIAAAARSLFASYPGFREADQWIVLLHQSDIIANSHALLDFAGGGMVTGLVAQVLGAFRDIGFKQGLFRFTLDCGGIRFGFEHIQGPWTAIYRVDSARQTEAFSCATELHQLITKMSASTASLEISSRFSTRIPTEYALYRPHLYRRAERAIRAALTDARLSWDYVWFRHRDRVVMAIPRNGDATQEIHGPAQQLVDLICSAFQPLSDRAASNLVMHAPGITLWFDFYPWGFWATRFDGNKVVFRRVAEQAAQLGERCVTEALQPA